MSPYHLLRSSVLTLSLITLIPWAAAKSVRDDGVENPPLLEIQRSGLEAVKPLAKLKKSVAMAQPTGPQEAYLTWRVTYTESSLWNPATGRDDRVRLRSYQGTLVNPDAPFVAPTIRVAPGDTIRATLSNQLPGDPSCYDHEQPVNKPHCFKRHQYAHARFVDQSRWQQR
jgi:FtsP/CotA-like multicopper oxidase with cupredoxin domain